jgi:hypothetical protein
VDYHILNGDALKEQFPADALKGELIVTRECMIEGPTQANTLDELLKKREQYLRETYQVDYQDAVPEIKKIASLSTGSACLWFEDDLFCQANLWFVCSLIYQKDLRVFLVRPHGSLRYGFGGMDRDGLMAAYEKRQLLTPIQVNQFTLLWFAYRQGDIERLLKLGVQMYSDFPFVMNAIEAHLDRLPDENGSSKLYNVIAEIVKEKATTDFASVFSEFQKRAAIFGFGDIQFKRIFQDFMSSQA